MRETLQGKPCELVSELYNLADDISETTNLAERHPEMVKQLHDALERFNQDLQAQRRAAGTV